MWKYALLAAAMAALGFSSGAWIERNYTVGGFLKQAGVRSFLERIGVVAVELVPGYENNPDADTKQVAAVKTACPDLQKGRVMVALVAGQSNAANTGVAEAPEVSDSVAKAVSNYYNGDCYEARDPLLGSTGAGASVWLRMSYDLVASGIFDQVVLVPAAVGGTDIRRWARGGDLHPRLVQRARAVESQGLKITHFLWHQGESDALQTTSEKYAEQFTEIVDAVREAAGQNVPVFLAQATLCQEVRSGPRVRDAQRSVATAENNIYLAADSDAIGYEHRVDGCHFWGSGLDLLATSYAKAIAKHQHPYR